MKQRNFLNNSKTVHVRRSVADRDNNSLFAKLHQLGLHLRIAITDFRAKVQNVEQLFSRIIVKKYDCFNRNLRDYLNVSDELDKLGVNVHSLSEQFNTETKKGHMMKNNLLNFAEFDVKQAFVRAIQ